MLFSAAPAAAQFPPERATNLRVLPKDMTMDSLVNVMGGFTRALGVRCGYCHVQKEGQSLDQIDFALDDNPRKGKAREMLRMVASINGDHLSRLSDRRQPLIRVTCLTCHRGVAEPRMLQQLLSGAYVAGGADSAESLYRALKNRYYGSAAYDFTEVPLADFAGSIVKTGNIKDALRFHTLNADANPGSTFALRQLGQTYLAAHDTVAAIAAYQRALKLNPNDSQSKRAVEALQSVR